MTARKTARNNVSNKQPRIECKCSLSSLFQWFSQHSVLNSRIQFTPDLLYVQPPISFTGTGTRIYLRVRKSIVALSAFNALTARTDSSSSSSSTSNFALASSSSSSAAAVASNIESLTWDAMNCRYSGQMNSINAIIYGTMN